MAACLEVTSVKGLRVRAFMPDPHSPATKLAVSYVLMDCSACDQDRRFLLARVRPAESVTRGWLSAVDLFSGCGGLSLGLQIAASDEGLGVRWRLAVDNDRRALDTFRANVTAARLHHGRVEELFDGALGRALTSSERLVRKQVGPIDFLLAGPPCQGHSDLNNHTRRSDPRNGLYACLARAAEVLTPRVIVIENVPAVLNDHAGVAEATAHALGRAGYTVESKVLDLSHFGVPQRRKRHTLIAMRPGASGGPLLDRPADEMCAHGARTVDWAIRDLEGRSEAAGFDAPSRASAINQARMEYLIRNDVYELPNELRPDCHRHKTHTYVSMYGRLRWNDPAQTITSGFGSMGQGRYVHPSEPRTVTPHEAARLQTFPDYFRFSSLASRSAIATMIGNAVPPLFSRALMRRVLRSGVLAGLASQQGIA